MPIYTVKTTGLKAQELLASLRGLSLTAYYEKDNGIFYRILGATDYQRFIALLIKLEIEYFHAT